MMKLGHTGTTSHVFRTTKNLLWSQVNSIKNVLATETRARISGDDDNSRRLRSQLALHVRHLCVGDRCWLWTDFLREWKT